MSTSEPSDYPEENPFEVSAGSHLQDPYDNADGIHQADDTRMQVPPIESSYWTGLLVLGTLSISSCLFSSIRVPVGVFGVVGTIGWMLVLFANFLIPLLPLSLIRLAIHRHRIAQAIDQQAYPGGQRFGLGYLISSLLLSLGCLFGGGVLFFGVCTALLYLSDGGPLMGRSSEWTLLPLLALDGIVSFIATGFLINLSVPKYR